MKAFCETPERTKIMANNAVLGLQTSDLSLPRAMPHVLNILPATATR